MIGCALGRDIGKNATDVVLQVQNSCQCGRLLWSANSSKGLWRRDCDFHTRTHNAHRRRERREREREVRLGHVLLCRFSSRQHREF